MPPALIELAAWLHASTLARVLRGGVWLYPLVNVAHVLGVALLFGAVSVLDLRLMGLWRPMPLRTLARPTLAVAAGGFAVTAVSGALLLVVQADEYVTNPVLYAKFAAIGLAGLNAALLHRAPAWRAAQADGVSERRLARAGAASLLCWLAALVAGRLIAYW